MSLFFSNDHISVGQQGFLELYGSDCIINRPNTTPRFDDHAELSAIVTFQITLQSSHLGFACLSITHGFTLRHLSTFDGEHVVHLGCSEVYFPTFYVTLAQQYVYKLTTHVWMIC